MVVPTLFPSHSYLSFYLRTSDQYYLISPRPSSAALWTTPHRHLLGTFYKVCKTELVLFSPRSVLPTRFLVLFNGHPSHKSGINVNSTSSLQILCAVLFLLPMPWPLPPRSHYSPSTPSQAAAPLHCCVLSILIPRASAFLESRQSFPILLYMTTYFLH